MNKPAAKSKLSEGAPEPVASRPLLGTRLRLGELLVVKRQRQCYPSGQNSDLAVLGHAATERCSDGADHGYLLVAVEPALPFLVPLPGLPPADYWSLLLGY